jgi:transcription elongation factor GreA
MLPFQFMDTQKEYLSKEKNEELKEELEFLTHVKRKEIAEALEAAKALGDLSENAEYHSAREAQAAIEERIMVIEEILKNAVIVSAKHKTDTVGIGSVVKVKRGKDTKTYTIVGGEETDILLGKISNKSPLGEAMMNKRKGDSCAYVTPMGEMECEILEIK